MVLGINRRAYQPTGCETQKQIFSTSSIYFFTNSSFCVKTTLLNASSSRLHRPPLLAYHVLSSLHLDAGLHRQEARSVSHSEAFLQGRCRADLSVPFPLSMPLVLSKARLDYESSLPKHLFETFVFKDAQMTVRHIL